jgi:hypothetical protein
MVDDAESSEALSDAETPEENGYGEYLSRIVGHGEPVTVKVSDEVWDEVEEIMLADRDVVLREHFVRIGSLMSWVASMEDTFNPLATYLLNPFEPGRAAPAVANLGAAQLRSLTRVLLEPRWQASNALFVECLAIAQFRNQVAHNGLVPFRVVEDGKRVLREVHIERTSFKGGSVTRELVDLPLSLLDEWVARAQLAGKVASRVLILLTEMTYVGVQLVPTTPLNIVFMDPEGRNPHLWTETDRTLFARLYGPLD